MTAPKSMLDAIEPTALDAMLDRREAIAHGAKTSSLVTTALALGSIPVMLGALASVAPAQTATQTVIDVLQYALLLENLESEFYKAVLGTSSVAAFNTAFTTVRGKLNGVDATIIPTLQLLSQHEIAHVAYLRQVISAAGGTPTTYDPAATFDFTGGRGATPASSNPFYQATQDVAFLLAATQGFEDTGVRAYKGQAGKLLGQAYLTPALQIHALEARHAARIRRIRRINAAALFTPTTVRLSGTVKGDAAAAAGAPTNATLPAAVVTAFNAIYGGEGNATQAGVVLASLPNIPGGTDPTQAFDEALGATAVAGIIQPFIIPNVTLPANVALT